MSTGLQQAETAAPASTGRQQLMQVARTGLGLLVRVVPPLVGAGLLGALKGGLLFGLLGLVASVGFVALPSITGAPPLPLWLKLLSLALMPAALAFSGGYALALKAVANRLAQEAQERGLVGYLYAVIKPTALQVARRLRGSGSLSRAELTREIERSLAERLREASASDPSTPSRAERLERALINNSNRILCFAMLMTAASAPDAPAAVRELENLGIQRLEDALGETLEDVFSFQMMLALGGGLLVAALPPVLSVLLR